MLEEERAKELFPDIEFFTEQGREVRVSTLTLAEKFQIDHDELVKQTKKANPLGKTFMRYIKEAKNSEILLQKLVDALAYLAASRRDDPLILLSAQDSEQETLKFFMDSKCFKNLKFLEQKNPELFNEYLEGFKIFDKEYKQIKRFIYKCKQKQRIKKAINSEKIMASLNEQHKIIEKVLKECPDGLKKIAAKQLMFVDEWLRKNLSPEHRERILKYHLGIIKLAEAKNKEEKQIPQIEENALKQNIMIDTRNMAELGRTFSGKPGMSDAEAIEYFRFMWTNYVEQNPAFLTEDEQALRQEIIEMVQKAS